MTYWPNLCNYLHKSFLRRGCPVMPGFAGLRSTRIVKSSLFSAERTLSMTAFRFISPRSSVITGALLLAAVTRLIPHPPNFAPITAMALFGAATLTDKRVAFLMPLIALFASDLCIEVMHRMGLMESWGFYSGMWVTYT